MHFLCFRPERLQTCPGCHKANNLTLSHSKLPCDQELPLWPSMTTFLPEQAKWSVKRRYFPLFICWREGDYGEVGDQASPPFQFILLLSCASPPIAQGFVCFVTGLHLSPLPSHALNLFTLLSLSDSLATFGLPDKKLQHRSTKLSQVELLLSCFQARDLCVSDTPQAGWLNMMLLPTQPLPPTREEANSCCKA